MSHPKKPTTVATLTQIATDDDKVHETVPGSSPDQVYGTERGQHRFVLEFPRPYSGRDMDDITSPVLMEREPLLLNTCNNNIIIPTIIT